MGRKKKLNFISKYDLCTKKSGKATNFIWILTRKSLSLFDIRHFWLNYLFIAENSLGHNMELLLTDLFYLGQGTNVNKVLTNQINVKPKNMQTETVYSSDLTFNLEIWKRELKFHMSELDMFQQKLEEIASREDIEKSSLELESYQNKIIIERDAIRKLLHRCRAKLGNLHSADHYKNIDGQLQYEKRPLYDDLKHYIKLHYEFKEDIMDFFSKWL